MTGRQPHDLIFGQYEIAASAGTGAEVISERITDRVKFRRAWMRRHGLESHRCRIVKVTGESMEPTLPNGTSIAGRDHRPTFAPTCGSPLTSAFGQGINHLPATRCA